MRLAIVEYGCDFKETYRRLSTGQGSTYHSHPYIFDLMRELSQQLEEVIYVCCCTESCQNTTLQPGLRSINAGLDPYKEVDKLIALLEAQNLTHLVIHFPQRRLFQWAARQNIRVMGILADSFELPGWRNRIRYRLLAQSLNHPRIDWVGNHGTASCRSLARIGVNPAKIVPWDWVYTNSPSQFPPKTVPTAASWNLLYVGLVAESKGVGDVIDAIAHLKKRQISVSFKIAGKGQIDLFRDRARHLQVEDHIEFLGLVPHQQIYHLMRSADIVVVPSHHSYPEGFPLTIYESLCTRTPLIASDHPMFTHVLRNGETVLMFPEKNAIALADCVQRLVSQPRLYERLSFASEAAWQRLQLPVKWGDLLVRWLSGGVDDRQWLSDYSLASRRYDSFSQSTAEPVSV